MPRWTAVIPVYNERDFLPATLRSLAAQTTSCRVIVVDNGSKDGCIADAKELVARLGLDAVFLEEPRPGQVHALKHGIDAADSELIAICDADTWYPPQYLAAAEAVFDRKGKSCVAACAMLLPDAANSWRTRLTRWHKLGAARLMPRQNHTSGAAQCFRLETLRRAGGYDAGLWPFVLKDHELMHRVLEYGTQGWDADLWCISSDRRRDRSGVRWTLQERLLYHVMPYRLKTWFFHDLLAPRFQARGMADTVLRARAWDGGEPPSAVGSA